jgi:hypothetical protein
MVYLQIPPTTAPTIVPVLFPVELFLLDVADLLTPPPLIVGEDGSSSESVVVSESSLDFVEVALFPVDGVLFDLVDPPEDVEEVDAGVLGRTGVLGVVCVLGVVGESVVAGGGGEG